MKSWQLITLGLILICLIVLYFFNQKPMNQQTSKVFITLLPEIQERQPDSLEAFSRSDNETQLILKKDQGMWQVFIKGKGRGFWAPAKAQKVRKLLGDLTDFTGELRSSSHEYLKDFGLGKGQGLEIALKKDGKEMVRIVVGKKGPSWGSCFVKRADSDKVFLITRDILADFDIWGNQSQETIEIRPWVDRSVITLTPIDVKQCSLGSKKTLWSLEKEEPNGSNRQKETWNLVLKGQKRSLTSKEANRILNRFFPLYAQDIVPPTDFHGQKTLMRFIYRDMNNKVHSLLIGSCSKAKAKDKTCLVKDDRGYVYSIDGSVVDEMRNPLVAIKKRRQGGQGNNEK